MITFFILVGISFVGIVLVFWLLKNEDKPSLRNLEAPMPTATSSATLPAKKPSLFTRLFAKSRKEAIIGTLLPAAPPSATPQVKKPSLLAGFFTKFKKEKKEAMAEIPLSNVTDFLGKSSLGTPIRATKFPVAPRVKKPSLLAGLFAKFKKEKKSSGEEAITQVPLPSVTDFVEKSFVVYQDKPEADSAAPEVALSAAEEKKIEQEIDLAAQIEEWKIKYERLDKLFNEKSTVLAKSEEAIQNELNNRKEFNKLKDILEKELKEAKDKTRSIQVELNTAKTEAEGHKKRINQLEEKIVKAEKVLLEKDDEIADLTKRLKAATIAPPVVAAAPESNLSPHPTAEPPPAIAPVVPQISVQSVAVPEQVAPVEPPAVPPPVTPGHEEGTAGGEQAPAKEEKFLKLQPDILAVTNPPPSAPVGPELEQSELGEPKQSSDPVLPEANPQGPQDKSASEGKTNQQDEQKKE